MRANGPNAFVRTKACAEGSLCARGWPKIASRPRKSEPFTWLTRGLFMNSGGAAMFYLGVVWGGAYTLGPFVIVGQAPQGHQPGDLATRIGAWAYINSHTVIYAGNIIGTNLRVGHRALIREQNEIGDSVSIGSGSNVEHHVRIGNR